MNVLLAQIRLESEQGKRGSRWEGERETHDRLLLTQWRQLGIRTPNDLFVSRSFGVITIPQLQQKAQIAQLRTQRLQKRLKLEKTSESTYRLRVFLACDVVPSLSVSA
jgi:hypothetical protein